MFDFDPFKSRMVLTTPGKHDYWFRPTEMRVEQHYCEPIRINAELEFERESPEGSKMVMAPNVPHFEISDAMERAAKRFNAKRIVINPPATVVLWKDGTKTVVKCDKDDEYNAMTGVLLCYMKKALGNTSREFNKALREVRKYVFEEDKK